MPTRISFSTTWPERMGDLAGEPTYFVERIWTGLQFADHKERTVLYNHYRRECRKITGSDWPNEWPNILWQYPPKTTTIRSNYDYWKSKEGQMIQPFFWAGKPYRSKQVVFCPEVRLAKVLKAEINNTEGRIIATDVEYDSGFYVHANDQERIMRFTQNEGFDHPDHFWMWFDKDMDGCLLELESVEG